MLLSSTWDLGDLPVPEGSNWERLGEGWDQQQRGIPQPLLLSQAWLVSEVDEGKGGRQGAVRRAP